MKKPLLLTLLVGTYSLLLAQLPNVYVQKVDSITARLDKSAITTGILYDRVAPLASLDLFNTKTDTAEYSLFTQSYFEMFQGSYHTDGWQSPGQVDSLIWNNNISGIVPIGVLDYRFNMLNRDATNKSVQFKDGLLYDLPGRMQNRYVQHRIQLTVPLAKSIKPGTIRLKFLPQLYKTNQALTIRSITVTGLTPNAIDLPVDGSTVDVLVSSPGKKVVQIKVAYANGERFSNTSILQVEKGISISEKATAAPTPDSSFWISSTIPFQGYDESAPYCGKNKVTIFYRGTDNTPKPIMKPIIVLDGFDPANSRDAQKIYTESFKYIDQNNQPANFADELRTEGFDLVMVDHPPYNNDIRTINDPDNQFPYPPTLINGGGDYIQRNAMVLVALIQKLNNELKANGSSEKIIVVGPSMGGQISRYALRYMEVNKMDHNCKLWVSFDSPHQGALLPLGLQYLIQGFSSFSDAAKRALETEINCPAAKEMLIHHYLSGQELPTGAPNFKDRYYQELNTLGWPEQCRKIAMLSGSEKGLPVQPGTPGMKAISVELKLKKVTRFLLLAGLVDPVFIKGDVYLAPDQQQGRGKVFDGRIILNNLADRYAQAPSYARQSMDLIPSGYYPGFEEIKEASEEGWSTNFLSNLLNQNFDALLQVHAHEPLHSSLALGEGSNPNPTREWDDDISGINVTCGAEKESPFDAYWAPDINTRHDSLLYDHVIRLRDEFQGIPMQNKTITESITGNVTGYMCIGSTRYFQVDNTKPDQQFAWNTSSPGLAIESGQGTSSTSVAYTGGLLAPGQYISLQTTHPCYNIVVNNLPFPNDFAFQPDICGGCALYSITPNPAHSLLHIAATGSSPLCALTLRTTANRTNAAISAVKIFDVNGNLYYHRRFENVQEATLNVNGLPTGMYIVEIRNGRSTERQEVLISK